MGNALLKPHLDNIIEFMESYDLEDTEGILWDLLLYTFSCNDTDNWNGFRRNNTLHFYKLLLGFIKGVHGITVPMLAHFNHKIPINFKP